MQGPTNFKQLEAFRAVMLTGTTVRAAEMLHITQPAVSRYLHLLEVDVGFDLFERRKGRLHPTSEGEALFEEVQQTFAGLGRLRRVAEDIRHLRRGHLRLVATTPLAQTLIPIALVEFRSIHPDVTVSVDIAARRELRTRIDAQQFDLALVTLPYGYAGADVAPLVKVNDVCVLPFSHQLAGRKIVRAKDLEHEYFISQSPDTLARLEIDKAFADASVTRNLAIETQTVQSVCELVSAGLGVSVVDPFTASVFKGSGLHVLPFGPKISCEYGVLFPAGRPPSHIAQAFLEIVGKHARRYPQAFKKP